MKELALLLRKVIESYGNYLYFFPLSCLARARGGIYTTIGKAFRGKFYNNFKNLSSFFQKQALKGKKGVKMSNGINKDDLNDFKRLLKRFKRGIIDALSKIFNRGFVKNTTPHYLKFQKKRR